MYLPQLKELLGRLNPRLLAGIALALVALLALGRNLWSTVATEAYLNAPLMEPISPIAGRISESLPPVGSRLGSGASIQVDNDRADMAAFAEAQNKLAQTEAELAALEVKLKGLRAAQERARRQTRDFQRSKSRFLDQRVALLAARLDAARASVADRNDEYERLRQLSAGAVSVRDVVDAQARLTSARAAEDEARAEWDSYRVARQALDSGVQLTEGLPDRTWSEQKEQETALLLDTAEARKQELAQLRNGQAEALAALRDHLERQQHVAVPVPDGVVWRRVPASAYVSVGGNLGAVAVCTEVVATATVRQRDFERLYVGMLAKFASELRGDGRIELEGEVISLIGPALSGMQPMALPFGRAASENGYGVVVRLRDAGRMRCQIGTSARMRFIDRFANEQR